MSDFIIFLPANPGFHAEVTASVRRRYFLRFPDWLDLLRKCDLPVLTSLQGVDLLLMGMTEADLHGIDHCAAPFGHLLPSLWEKHKGFRDHVKWNFRNGVHGSVPFMFVPEFDIPQLQVLGAPTTIFAVPHPDTICYSACLPDEFRFGEPVRGRKTYRYQWDHVLVPMGDMQAVQKAFFTWQRFMDDASLSALLRELDVVMASPDPLPKVFFMDLEAPIVGSHHGLEVWKRLFEVLKKHCGSHIISATAAEKRWRAAADPERDAEGERLFSRYVGGKWLSHRMQVEFRDKILEAPVPTTEREHVIASLFTNSDVLAAWDRMFRTRGVVLSADLGDITIWHDPAVITVAQAAFRPWREKRGAQAVIDSLHAAASAATNADEAWYIRECARVVDEVPA